MNTYRNSLIFNMSMDARANPNVFAIDLRIDKQMEVNMK